MEIKDTYSTISKPSKEVLFKDRGSKFFGYAFPITITEEVKSNIEDLKQLHSNAGHFCYAYEIGIDGTNYRYSDDGEPGNSAGAPIYGQLQSFDVTNVLIVVVRYFGGTKLGVGGLRNAYKTTAKMALDESDIVEKVITQNYKVEFGYDLMNEVMRLIKSLNLNIINQEMNERCIITFEVKLSDAENMKDRFKKLHKATLKKLAP